MITHYTKTLQQIAPHINWQEFKRKVRTKRKWHSKHFENRYLERVLRNVIKNY
jgi:hypothetical protein